MPRCEHYGNQNIGDSIRHPVGFTQCTNPAEFEIYEDGLYCLKHKDEIEEEDNLIEGLDYAELS